MQSFQIFQWKSYPFFGFVMLCIVPFTSYMGLDSPHFSPGSHNLFKAALSGRPKECGPDTGGWCGGSHRLVSWYWVLRLSSLVVCSDVDFSLPFFSSLWYQFHYLSRNDQEAYYNLQGKKQGGWTEKGCILVSGARWESLCMVQWVLKL